MKRTSVVARLVTAVMMAVCLTAAAAGPLAAQREPHDLTRAQQVRELVLKQRGNVLAQIDAIMSGKKGTSQQAQVETAEEGEVPAEDGEPEGEEPEDGEAEGGEGEGEEGEGEEEDVLELPETGVGRHRGADGASSELMAALGALTAIGISARRRFTQDRGRAARRQPAS